MNYPVSCTCMINENPFSTPHSSAPPVAISLLEPCVKGMKEGKEAGKPQGKEFVAKKKKRGEEQAAMPLLPGLARCLLICSGTALHLYIYLYIYLFISLFIFLYIFIYIFIFCHTASGKVKA